MGNNIEISNMGGHNIKEATVGSLKSGEMSEQIKQPVRKNRVLELYLCLYLYGYLYLYLYVYL